MLVLLNIRGSQSNLAGNAPLPLFSDPSYTLLNHITLSTSTLSSTALEVSKTQGNISELFINIKPRCDVLLADLRDLGRGQRKKVYKLNEIAKI